MRQINRLKLSFYLCMLTIFIALAGCSIQEIQPDDKAKDQNLLVTDSEKSVSFDSFWGPYYDWSGSVEVTYYLKSTYGTWNTVTATVPDDTVCIGGGAFCEYENNPGYLTGSWPTEDLRSWNAQSKDHWYYGYHKLTVVATGLRLKDAYGNYIPSEIVRSFFNVVSTVSEGSSEASTSVSGEYVVSGGARVLNPFDYIGQLLVESRMYYNSNKVKSASCVYDDPKSIISYAVSYDFNEIPNFGYLHIINKTNYILSPSSSKGSVTSSPTEGWVMAGVGGIAFSNRLLTALGIYNFNSGISGFEADTDFLSPSSNWSGVSISELQKDKRGDIPAGYYYIRNRWTGEYIYDSYRADDLLSVGWHPVTWYITNFKEGKDYKKYYSVKNNETGRYIHYNGKIYNFPSTVEFWRYSADFETSNSTNPNGYYAIGGVESDYNYLFHIENQRGYIETLSTETLPSYWWSKDWYLEPANY